MNAPEIQLHLDELAGIEIGKTRSGSVESRNG